MLIYCTMIYVNIFHILTRNYHFTLLWQTLSNDPRNRISLRSLARIALKLHWYIHGQCKLPVQRYSSERINAKRFPNRGGPDFLGEIIVDEGRRRRRHPWIGSRVGQWKRNVRVREKPGEKGRTVAGETFGVGERRGWLQSCELKIQRRTR